MKAFTGIFLVFTILGLTACDEDECINGEGSLISQTIEVNPFHGVEIPGSSHVTISQGSEQKVTVRTHENLVNRIETRVLDGIWHVKFETGCYKNTHLEVTIEMPNLDYVSISGSGDVLINDFEDQELLTTQLSGSGNITLNEYNGATRLNASIMGSGTITCLDDFDSLEDLDIAISGSGNFNGFPATSEEVRVAIAGSGQAKVSAVDQLDVAITGSGNVYYQGSPSINSSITGSGRLIDSN